MWFYHLTRVKILGKNNQSTNLFIVFVPVLNYKQLVFVVKRFKHLWWWNCIKFIIYSRPYRSTLIICSSFQCFNLTINTLEMTRICVWLYPSIFPVFSITKVLSKIHSAWYKKHLQHCAYETNQNSKCHIYISNLKNLLIESSSLKNHCQATLHLS